MKTDFISARDGDLDSQEENFIEKLQIHKTALGLNDADVTDAVSIINQHRNAFKAMTSKKSEAKSAIEENHRQRINSLAEFRRIARQIKSSKSYTSSIGEDLGIIGSDVAEKDSASLKPSLSAKVNGHEVILKFRKEGTDGIKLYCKRGNESEFTFLSLNTASPYTDSREKLDPSKPEQRDYYCYFFSNDTEIGLQSDILKAIIP